MEATREMKVRTIDSGNRCETLDSILRQSLARFAALYNVVPSESLPGIWFEALRDLEPGVLTAALRRVEREFVPTHACPFPVPAHIRQMLAKVNDNEKTVEAESAWEKALDWSRHKWHPDLRNSRLPALPHKIVRALGAAGGTRHLWECSEEETQWARKRFIEFYLSLDQLESDQHFLTGLEAKAVLRSLMPSNDPARMLKSLWGERNAHKRTRT